MYGLVNQGIFQYLKENFGEQTLSEICAEAQVDIQEFEQMLSYDDDITYRLVSAISTKLDVPAEDVLKLFGEYWPDYSKDSSVGKLIRFGGQTYIEALESLDDMHSRVKVAMPNLRPPSFEVEQISEQNYLLHYYSEREGLAPMVTGLLHGLAEQYGITVDVDIVSEKKNPDDPVTFELNLQSAEILDKSAA